MEIARERRQNVRTIPRINLSRGKSPLSLRGELKTLPPPRGPFAILSIPLPFVTLENEISSERWSLIPSIEISNKFYDYTNIRLITDIPTPATVINSCDFINHPWIITNRINFNTRIECNGCCNPTESHSSFVSLLEDFHYHPVLTLWGR